MNKLENWVMAGLVVKTSLFTLDDNNVVAHLYQSSLNYNTIF